jgi:hypothetical protein
MKRQLFLPGVIALLVPDASGRVGVYHYTASRLYCTFLQVSLLNPLHNLLLFTECGKPLSKPLSYS